MRPFLLAVLLLLSIFGCSSKTDVEKCVDANLAAWKENPDKYWAESEVEARALFYKLCLRRR